MTRNPNYKPLVFISSPFSGDVESNIVKARKYCRFAVDNGYIPVAPHLLYPQFMNEKNERDSALHMGIVLLGKCEEVWVFGDTLSEGMLQEVLQAEYWGKIVRCFNEACEEVKHA
ncbi:DUF4406 domain-containing protein [Pseudolactococcus insecticola]|uniref:DUF7768 domain-containing protein n=1 Tax=Pseudolactococcus insecticola TaxID=2709158 RepID=A0A6A0B6A6_9LACT|nr:DUF4406 domain-containing protein [Lactococcus insecticola]GFH40255.1 hypothetical protein Hs20B_06530 [Lactococcus insecticola]